MSESGNQPEPLNADERRTFVELLRRYCLDVDQFDQLKVVDGRGIPWWVDISILPNGETGNYHDLGARYGEDGSGRDD